MKLRNKKTGKIVRAEFLSNWQTDDGTEIGFRVANTLAIYSYNSLAELNEEWEDAPEEPKGYWYIEPNGVVARIDEWDCCTENDREVMKLIGNYFETEEEAEKAVEKLKAWKRLKDKGFKFELWDYDGYNDEVDTGRILFRINKFSEEDKDLDLLFGGKQ